MAVHFGGIHGWPWLLDQGFHDRFGSLSIGLVFANSPERDTLETRFIGGLRPIANGGVYTEADPRQGLFHLEVLAERWLTLTAPKIGVTEADLQKLQESHEAVVGSRLRPSGGSAAQRRSCRAAEEVVVVQLTGNAQARAIAPHADPLFPTRGQGRTPGQG